ncbi:MAG: hypothetical protein ACI8PB_000229 [Desulforhopalus sp.]|jgi:hypothetical protein
MFLILVVLVPVESWAQLQSRYVTVRYSNKQLLHDFNDELVLNRKLRYYLRKKNIVTVQDEVIAKLDVLIEKAEVVLDMFPSNLHITVVLLGKRKDVANMYKSKYGKKANHIAYYSLKEKTIYISVNDTKLRVIAHEIGHAIVDHYFKVRPPYNIHELMAQFTEKHIGD